MKWPHDLILPREDRDGPRLNGSAREYSVKSALSNSKDWILRYIRTYLFLHSPHQFAAGIKE